jgi:hypothetical protein
LPRPPRRLRVGHGRGDMAADAIGRAAQRVRVKMRVARCRARLRVPKQLADDRQPEPCSRADARTGMAQVVNADPVQPGPLRHC